MLSCLRGRIRFVLRQRHVVDVLNARIVQVLQEQAITSPHEHKFHLDCSRQIKFLPTVSQKFEDEEGKKIQYILVKAPPGASDTTVPGKLEWEKTVGARVYAGAIVCRIRFKDGRSLEIPAPSNGVLAMRMKNEGEPVHQSEELFKIRLDSNNGEDFRKKKRKKKKINDADEEEENTLTETGYSKHFNKSSTQLENTIVREQHSNSNTEQKEQGRLKESSVGQPKSEQPKESYFPNGNVQVYPPYGIQQSFQPPLHGLNASLMTSMDEINMVDTMKFFEKQDKLLYPSKPSFRSFYIKTAAFVLSMSPSLNIRILNNEVIKKKNIDITIGFQYLKVMVFHTFKDANKMHHMDISRILQLIKKQVAEGTYRAEKNSPEFTISQEWERGSVFGTPRYSKTCTLGLHKIIKRPIVEENQITAHPMMYVSLTYDNSIIPVEDAIKFLKMYKLALEEPRYILINSDM